MLRFWGFLICLTALMGCHQAKVNQYYGHTSNIDRTIGIKQRENVTDAIDAKIENELKGKGVSIISVGQDYRVIMPADLIYYYQSPRLRRRSFDIINLVVDYIKQFRVVSMRVDAYSQDKDIKRSGALSLARARSLVDYLWSQAIDTRILYTQAHSMERSITACCNDKRGIGDVPTRVEITFRSTIV